MLTQISAGGPKDIDIAVKAAKQAFKSSWGLKMPGSERGKLMYKLADLLEKNEDMFAAIEALDGGTRHFPASTVRCALINPKQESSFTTLRMK